jgi:DNA invertase Pin-like site-specific DNA recombinase
LGLAAQKAKIKAAAKQEGWEIIWLVDVESGKDTDRPAFREALELIADGRADGLTAVKIDRIARSVVDFGMLLEFFDRAEATLAILDPAIDTSTPSGRLVANVIASVAEWEREVIAQRTADALQAKRSEGKVISRASVTDNKQLSARILSLREEGLSLGAIAKKLNQEGVPTMRGAPAWSTSALQTCLGYQRPRKAHKVPDLPKIRRAAGKRAAA